MYSISENLDNTEFSGWINEEILIKDSRRSTTSRKRNYDLTNVDIGDECEDIRRRVLRPRHNTEPQSSNGASRTRPFRSNRTRRSPTVLVYNDQEEISLPEEVPQPTQGLPQPPDPTLTSTANDLSFFQMLASNWPENYLLAHTDPSILQRLRQPAYSTLSNIQLNPRMPHFDPWVLHNYLLATSNYSVMAGSHLSPESNFEDSTRNMYQVGYPSLVSESVFNPNFIWEYPFLLNPSYSSIQSHTTRSDLASNMPASPHNLDHLNLAHLFTPPNTTRRNNQSNSNETHTRSDAGQPIIYPNELPPLNIHVLPSPFSYGSLCPYHNTNHIHHPNQPYSRQMSNNGSNLPEPALSYPHHSFTAFTQQSEMSFGSYWPQMTSSVRPVNYPINSSNIDTLLHLAAHFEQRKRGITREELDKLPTHRYKTVSEKYKQKEKCKAKREEDLLKCLVCLEDFEVKQNIRTLRCNHEFHAKCIDKWLKINRSCPLCRADAFDGSAQKDAP